MITQIRSGKLKATIELFGDRVPQTVQRIRALLPSTVPLCHAKFAGDELMFMIPAVIEPEKFKSSIETGDVLYYPIQQTICLFFGDDIVPFGQGPFNAVGRIVDGKADLEHLADIIVRQGFQWAQFSQSDASGENARAVISQQTAEIIAERQNIWQAVPPELENLKLLKRGRAGNAAVRVYAFADTYRNQRNLWHLRDDVKRQNITVDTAKLLLETTLREMADRCDIWTLFTPGSLFRKAAGQLADVATSDELVNLFDELLIYNNRWWLWLDSCIPWFDLDVQLQNIF
ncbi:MAG: cyclophilin-like fold protein [Desulfobacterales bacterium]|jgi:hypothetical protein